MPSDKRFFRGDTAWHLSSEHVHIWSSSGCVYIWSLRSCLRSNLYLNVKICDGVIKGCWNRLSLPNSWCNDRTHNTKPYASLWREPQLRWMTLRREFSIICVMSHYHDIEFQNIYKVNNISNLLSKANDTSIFPTGFVSYTYIFVYGEIGYTRHIIGRPCNIVL